MRASRKYPLAFPQMTADKDPKNVFQKIDPKAVL
jgi:hypothetical protein